MSRFRNRTTYKYALLFLTVLILVGIAILAFPRETGIWVVALMSLTMFIIQAWLIDVKKSLSRVENLVKVASERANEADEVLGRLNRKAVKNEITVNDIAGSVGRTAPLVRQIRNSIVRNGSQDVPTSKVSSSDKLPDSKSSADPTAHGFKRIKSIEEFIPSQRRVTRRAVNVMTIADEFTLAAFQKEWVQFAPTRENYEEILEGHKIDLLFVESAWEGNGGDWRYQLVGQSAPRNEIKNLVQACKARGIPTAFWNKEDPPHFEDFLETAELFDFVFTTEERMVPLYKERLGHSRIFVLPFAAQPYYHNPARIASLQREGASVFGGMYFREKYPERRQQMDYLLPAAAEFGIDIFSRNVKEERYKFPETLQGAVRGSLTYEQMLAAYHSYRVVLNVNSVPNSESMCARRIFEATACGAAVVSPPTNAIRNFFPNDEITIVEDRDEARNSIRALLRSDDYRSRMVHRAQRRIWEDHTYSARVDEIFEKVGIHYSTGDVKTISLIVTTNRLVSFPYLIENIRRQAGCKFELLIATHGFDLPQSNIESLKEISSITRLEIFSVPSSNKLGANLNELVSRSNGDLIIRMDDDDWYGPNYVRDVVNAIEYSGADLVGKAATYIYFEAKNATVLTFEGHEHRYTDFVRGATFAGPRETFERFPFPELGVSEDSTLLRLIKEAGGVIYSADPYNFVVNRFADKRRHTWQADDAQLFATGRMVYCGNGQDQVDV